MARRPHQLECDLDEDCDCGASVEEQQAYRLITGKEFPSEPRPQDRAVAHACLAEYKRQERQWKAQERAAKRIVAATAGPLLPGGRAAVPLEKEEQIELAKHLDEMRLVWIHVPNEGRRSKQLGASLRAQGLKAGFPDVLIFSPAPNRPDVRFVAIELKRLKGGRTSENQRQWIRELRVCGGLAQICKGAAEAKWWLESLGYTP